MSDEEHLKIECKVPIETAKERKIRIDASLAFLTFFIVLMIILCTGGVYYLFMGKANWLLIIISTHFMPLFIPPLLMIASLAVVLSLRQASGPLEFKVLGFEVKGSAAPIIMWVLIFLCFVYAVQMFWPMFTLPPT